MISSLIITIFPGIRINKSNFVNKSNIGIFIRNIDHFYYIYSCKICLWKRWVCIIYARKLCSMLRVTYLGVNYFFVLNSVKMRSSYWFAGAIFILCYVMQGCRLLCHFRGSFWTYKNFKGAIRIAIFRTPKSFGPNISRTQIFLWHNLGKKTGPYSPISGPKKGPNYGNIPSSVRTFGVGTLNM